MFAGQSATLNQQNSTFSEYFKKRRKKKDVGSFGHALGATLFIAPSNNDNIDNSALAYGVSYFPSFPIAALNMGVLRLGVSPTVGITGTINSQSGGEGVALAFDLPVDLELHFGDTDFEGFGGHIGLGLAYNRIATQDFGENKAYGPHATAGINFILRGRPLSLRTSFLFNLNNKEDDYGNDWKNVFGLSLANYF